MTEICSSDSFRRLSCPTICFITNVISFYTIEINTVCLYRFIYSCFQFASCFFSFSPNLIPIYCSLFILFRDQINIFQQRRRKQCCIAIWHSNSVAYSANESSWMDFFEDLFSTASTNLLGGWYGSSLASDIELWLSSYYIWIIVGRFVFNHTT